MKRSEHPETQAYREGIREGLLRFLDAIGELPYPIRCKLIDIRTRLRERLLQEEREGGSA